MSKKVHALDLISQYSSGESVCEEDSNEFQEVSATWVLHNYQTFSPTVHAVSTDLKYAKAIGVLLNSSESSS